MTQNTPPRSSPFERSASQHKLHSAPISCVRWSPSGKRFASASDDHRIAVKSYPKLATEAVLEHGAGVTCFAWSESEELIASAARDGLLYLWKRTGERLSRVSLGGSRASGIGLDSDANLLVCLADASDTANLEAHGSIRVLRSPQTLVHSHGLGTLILTIGAQDGARLARPSGSDIFNSTAKVQVGRNFVAAFSGQAQVLAVSGENGQIQLIHGDTVRILEGHTKSIGALCFDPHGQLLASKSADGSVRLWSVSRGTELAALSEKTAVGWINACLDFHPQTGELATASRQIGTIRLWGISANVVEGATPRPDYVSAKIVMVGESNAGKSCLALRLVEDRFEEQGTTHGLRFWNLRTITGGDDGPSQQVRDAILWDMGGQNEYRLVHQLFLRDTTVALVLFDPTRGQTAVDDVEGWSKRLDTQLRGEKVVKLLVGSKLDAPSQLVDRATIERLRTSFGFEDFIETSAKNGRGVTRLRDRLRAAVNWETLTSTSRPDVFEAIRAKLAGKRSDGHVALLFDDLMAAESWPSATVPAASIVDAVVKQLAMQGFIADTRLATGERALILRIEEVERYAGSLIVMARDNSQGIPALEVDTLMRSKSFPGIDDATRLKPFEERIVLECVVQLLLEHGIGFRHQGLLIFPSLFRIAGGDFAGAEKFTASISYDFAGAIDNIYASLVARLALSEQFGRPRMSENRTDFDRTGEGVCSVRKKLGKRRNLAQLDIKFAEGCTDETRQLFTVFVEEHLRIEGIDIAEEVSVECPQGYRFDVEHVRERALTKHLEVLCPACEEKHAIIAGASQVRQERPEVADKLLVLKTRIDSKRRSAISLTRNDLRRSKENPGDDCYRILHLSDLHITDDTDVRALFEPLRADLKEQGVGPGANSLEYLVVSGDLTETAAPVQFEKALSLCTSIITEFKLNAQRCVVVPGNHDVAWHMPYDFRLRHQLDVSKLRRGTYYEQPTVVAVRNDERYAARFQRFSECFYHPLFQREFPMRYEDQHSVWMSEELGIQFIGLNSCWELDEFFGNRAGLHGGAVERALAKADEQLSECTKNGAHSAVLRIGVWHHPIAGPDTMENTDFVERLGQAGVSVCLTGHVHEARAESIHHLSPRQMYAIGGGALAARAAARPESTPRLYNLLRIVPDLRHIEVHTRCKMREGGAWEGWAQWPGAVPTERRTFYAISPRILSI